MALMNLSRIFLLALSLLFLVSGFSNAEDNKKPAIRVEVSAKPANVYSYRLIYDELDEASRLNAGSAVSLTIGFSGKTDDHYELTAEPVGYNWEERRFAKGSVTSPPGWIPGIITEEERAEHVVEWEASSSATGLKPGGRLDKFSIKTTEPDAAYKTGHWTVKFDNARTLSGVLQDSSK